MSLFLSRPFYLKRVHPLLPLALSMLTPPSHPRPLLGYRMAMEDGYQTPRKSRWNKKVTRKRAARPSNTVQKGRIGAYCVSSEIQTEKMHRTLIGTDLDIHIIIISSSNSSSSIVIVMTIIIITTTIISSL
jgi:hypothetical protein